MGDRVWGLGAEGSVLGILGGGGVSGFGADGLGAKVSGVRLWV